MNIKSFIPTIPDPVEAFDSDDITECFFISGESDVRNIIVQPNGKYLADDGTFKTNNDQMISPEGRYLIFCIDEFKFNGFKILINDLETGLKEEIIAKANEFDSNIGITQYQVLSIDATMIKINEYKYWLICAGTIDGHIILWYGKIDKIDGSWDFNNYNVKCISNRETKHKKPILSVKITRNKRNNKSIYIYSGAQEPNIRIWNIIFTIEKGSIIFQEIKLDAILKIVNSNNNQKNNIWVSTLDVDLNSGYLISGTTDNKIYIWDLEINPIQNQIPEILEGHRDAISQVKIISDIDDLILASCSQDNTIRIWFSKEKNEKNRFTIPCLHKVLYGHTNAVISIDFLNDAPYLSFPVKSDHYKKSTNEKIITTYHLVSASKDNKIIVWDMNKGVCIRKIDIRREELKKLNTYTNEEYIIGGYLGSVITSPDNRYIFSIRRNKIFMIRHHGHVWHFCKQLKFIKNEDSRLSHQLYYKNLLELAIYCPENKMALRYIYHLIMERLEHANSEIIINNSDYNYRILGSMFIPQFLKIGNIESRRSYIASVKSRYITFWNSISDIFKEKPNIPWSFKLYLTTNLTDDINCANFIEITNKKKNINEVLTLLDDRHQTAIQFLLILDNVPASFIPLFNAIILSVEDDKGDVADLEFSNFYFRSFKLNIVENVNENTSIIRQTTKVEHISNFYSLCTFKLDGGYNIERYANLQINRTLIDFTESLDPFKTEIGRLSFVQESEKKYINKRNNKFQKNDVSDINLIETNYDYLKNDKIIFESFRNNFQYPIFPKIKIRIGISNLRNSWSKKLDKVMAKLVFLSMISLTIDLLAALYLFQMFPSLEYIIPFITFMISVPGWISLIWVLMPSILKRNRKRITDNTKNGEE
ncbi:MAG: hypothetical protein ACTSPY_07150 [Candidatus Helarchaeota archaeon]